MGDLCILSRLFAEVSLDASINVKDLTVYKIGCLGCEEYSGT